MQKQLQVMGFSVLMLVLSLGISPVAIAQQEASAARAALLEDLRPVIQEFKRDFKLYHYFWEQNPSAYSSPERRQKMIEGRSQEFYSRFWRDKVDQRELINAGPGLYLAIDPSASRDFGNQAIVLTAPQGAKYLNVAKPVLLRDQTVNQLIAEGYVTAAQKGIFLTDRGPKGQTFSRDTLKNMIQPGFEKFRSLVHSIFLSESLVAIEYNWDTHLHGFCSNPKTSAFVWVGRLNSKPGPTVKVADSAQKTFISVLEMNKATDLEASEKEETLKLRSVLTELRRFAEMVKAKTMTSKEFRTTSSEIILQNYPDSSVVSKLKAQTFSCER